jgi:OmcA/MtrC family decaheme c-type cytochrome
MSTITRYWILAGLLGLLVACGGGGGGDRAQGVQPGPDAPGQPVDPPPPVVPEPVPSPYSEAEELLATITSVTIPEDGRPVVEWQLTDGNGVAIIDLEGDNVRFTLAKLQASELGNLTGTWQSYVNRIEEAGSVGPGTEDKLQGTYERFDPDVPPDETGEFSNNRDGTYSYRMLFNISEIDPDIEAQADAEGLDLSYEADRTHRVAMQFDGNDNTTANPYYDWEPASGARPPDVFSMDIAATENCNACHDPLGIHGGNRREVEYCVTCHNPGSTDANSGNTVDMKVMIHKIHMGRDLPSVIAGGEYVIWGFRDSEHNYSNLAYPGRPEHIGVCVNCHVGSGTVGDRDDLEVTSHGDNWAQVPSGAVCGSCHESEGAQRHIGGQEDADCASCHSTGGFAGSVEASHVIPTWEAAETQFAASVVDVDNSSPGQNPVVTFRIDNPATGEPWDIINDPAFTSPESRLAVGIAWDTVDYNNVGNQGENASQVQVNPVPGEGNPGATPNGDGSYSITMPVPIPGTATGSGAATIEGHPALDVDEDSEGLEEIPMTNVHAYFSIDEADGNASERREQGDLDQCLACHGKLSLHGGNRNDDLASCVTCHNPRNTDRRVREIETCEQPPDGKQEESIDFKTMVHGIHAAAMRENPLTIVGFRCFTTYVYDEENVHFPGNLANCATCHTAGGSSLPLAEGVLASTIDTGSDRADPSDDTVVTPISAVCSSCHDGITGKAESHGPANRRRAVLC